MDESVVERGKDAGDAKDKFYGGIISVNETTGDGYILGSNLSYRLSQESFRSYSPSENS